MLILQIRITYNNTNIALVDCEKSAFNIVAKKNTDIK